MKSANSLIKQTMFREIFSLKSLVIGLFFALLLSPFLNIIHYFLIPVFIIALYILEKIDLILLLIISSFLIISRNLSSDFRDILQYGNLIVLGYLFFTINLNNGKEFPRISRELTQFLILYFGALIVSSIFANSIFSGWEHILRQIIFFLIIYVLYSLINSLRTVIYFITSIIIAALFHTIFTIYALYQLNFDIVAFGTEYFLSLSSDFLTNKNTMGIYILFALVFSITLFNRQKSRILKYLSILMILILLSGLFLINSRAIILSFVVSGFFLIHNYKPKFLVYSLVALATFIALLFIPPLDGLMTSYFRVEDLFGQRDIITQTSWNLIQNVWQMGAGPGGTKELLYKYIPFMLGSPEELWIRHHFYQIEYGHAHNYFLFMLSDLGVLGISSAIFLIYAFFSIGNRVRRYYSEINRTVHSVIMAILSLGAGMFVRGLFEWGGILGYGMINTDLPFWISFSILVYFDSKMIDEIKNKES